LAHAADVMRLFNSDLRASDVVTKGKSRIGKEAHMYASKNHQLAVDEEIWSAWVHKGKLREQAPARRGRILVKIALVVLAVGLALYFLAARSTIV
jgi:hypothetical protein